MSTDPATRFSTPDPCDRPALVNLGRHIGNTKYDPDAQLVVVAVGSSNELAAIDPRSDRVVGRFPLPRLCGRSRRAVGAVASPRVRCM